MSESPFLKDTNIDDVKKSLEEDFKCSICLDIAYPCITYPCGHSLCGGCHVTSTSTTYTRAVCPQCKKPLCHGAFPTRNVAVSNFLKGVLTPKVVKDGEKREEKALIKKYCDAFTDHAFETGRGHHVIEYLRKNKYATSKEIELDYKKKYPNSTKIEARRIMNLIYDNDHLYIHDKYLILINFLEVYITDKGLDINDKELMFDILTSTHVDYVGRLSVKNDLEDNHFDFLRKLCPENKLLNRLKKFSSKDMKKLYEHLKVLESKQQFNVHKYTDLSQDSESSEYFPF